MANSLANDPLSREVDNLYEAAKRARDDALGQNWYQEAKQLFELQTSMMAVQPDWNPPVSIPRLQMLALKEITDLTDIVPRIYVPKHNDWSQRDEGNEQALAAQWVQSRANSALFYAFVWAFYAGRGFIQVGYDPFGRNGMGDIYADWRSPNTVVVDPYCKSDEDWQYLILDDELYIDQVARLYPESWKLIPLSNRDRTEGMVNTRPGELSLMRESPMASMPNGIFGAGNSQTGRVRLRTLLIRDNSVIELPSASGAIAGPDGIVKPRYGMEFPRGRIVVQANGVVIHSDNNWVPSGKFPLVSVNVMPSLTGFWPPPATRYSKGLQDKAEGMISQTYENAYRMNRQAAFVRADSGIDPEELYVLPDAVYEYSTNSVPPTLVAPPPLPPQYLQIPEMLLQLQDQIQGMTESREGNAPAGNISAPLIEAAISQAQVLTRMRTNFMADSVQRMGELMLGAMQVYYKSPRFIPGTVKGRLAPVQWTPVDPDSPLPAMLDPASVRVMSKTSMRMMVPLMRQLGLTDVLHALQDLEIPDAEERAAAIEQEMKLAAIAKVEHGQK